jgi:hypothetical protein
MSTNEGQGICKEKKNFYISENYSCHFVILILKWGEDMKKE